MKIVAHMFFTVYPTFIAVLVILIFNDGLNDQK